MRFKVKPKSDKSKWHKVFAWLPVCVNNEKVWLESVEARLDSVGDWEYRFIKKIDKNQKKPMPEDTPNVIFHYSFICPVKTCGMETEGVMKGKELSDDMELTCQWCAEGKAHRDDIACITQKQFEENGNRMTK